MKHVHSLAEAFTAASEKAIMSLFPTAALDFVAEARELLASGATTDAEREDILSFAWAKGAATQYCKVNKIEIDAKPAFRASGSPRKTSNNGKEGINPRYVTPPAIIAQERMKMQQKTYDWEKKRASELQITLAQFRVKNEHEWLPHVQNIIEWAKTTQREEWQD